MGGELQSATRKRIVFFSLGLRNFSDCHACIPWRRCGFIGAKVQIFSMQVAFFFLVRFYPYLLAGGLRFPSVDIDGYPVGAAHCHN